jgi:hypothetical protein
MATSERPLEPESAEIGRAHARDSGQAPLGATPEFQRAATRCPCADFRDSGRGLRSRRLEGARGGFNLPVTGGDERAKVIERLGTVLPFTSGAYAEWRRQLSQVE